MTPRDTPLTRDAILTRALAIVDAEGLRALSMRRLASELGIEAMSLYHHFRNKDAILDGLAAHIFLSMPALETPAATWQQAAEEYVVRFYRTLVAHPHVIPVVAARPFNTEATMGHIEGPMAAVTASGVDPQVAGEIYMALVSLSFGRAFLATQPAADASSPMRVKPEAYPASSAASPGMSLADESSLRRAVRALIRGYEQGE